VCSVNNQSSEENWSCGLWRDESQKAERAAEIMSHRKSKASLKTKIARSDNYRHIGQWKIRYTWKFHKGVTDFLSTTETQPKKGTFSGENNQTW
jgi:hypothetical protein